MVPGKRCKDFYCLFGYVVQIKQIKKASEAGWTRLEIKDSNVHVKFCKIFFIFFIECYTTGATSTK